jgi:hypothetical protein
MKIYCNLAASKRDISKLGIIALSILLLTGISSIPVLQAGVYAQQSQPQSQQQVPPQQNNVSLSQVIKQIAKQVATTNPGTNSTHIQQILIQLAKQTAVRTASKEQAIEDIRQIYSQIGTYPFGTVSQSLAYLAKQLLASPSGGSGNSNIIEIIQRIIEEKATTGTSISQSVVNIAIQVAVDAKSNKVNQDIRQAASQIIAANQTGFSVEKVESIIIQISLRIAQAQGKAVTGQFIYQIVNQIAKDPNGILAQAILQLVKQDDSGRTSQIINVINNVVAGGGSSSSSTIVKKFGNLIGIRIGDGGEAKKVDTFNCVAEGINICSEIKEDLKEIFPAVSEKELEEKFPVIKGEIPDDSIPAQLTGDTENVFIIADPASEEFVPLVEKAFKSWSDGMKQFSNRPDLWNVNIVSSKQVVGSFEKLPKGPNDIVVNLVGDPEETKAFLNGKPIEGKEQRDDPFGPSVIHVYTSNKVGPKNPELVYNTLLHEAGHSFKLQHPTVNGPCVYLMCDGETADEASFTVEPGPDEFDAVAHVHMFDGWKGVTRIIDSEDGYYDFGKDAKKPVSLGGYYGDNCQSIDTIIPCSEAIEVRSGYISNANIAGEPPDWCKNIGNDCPNYIVCEKGANSKETCRYEDEEGYTANNCSNKLGSSGIAGVSQCEHIAQEEADSQILSPSNFLKEPLAGEFVYDYTEGDDYDEYGNYIGPPLAPEDANLIENPQEDPNLFQFSSPTEQEQSEQTNDDGYYGLSASSSIGSGGATEGGGATPPGIDDGTTPGVAATDDGSTGGDRG